MSKTRLYAIIDTNKDTVQFVNNPDWGNNWSEKYGIPAKNSLALCIDGYAEGIPYSEELANINGCSFWLIVCTEEQKANVQKAKDKIRADRDVVNFVVRNYHLIESNVPAQ